MYIPFNSAWIFSNFAGSAPSTSFANSRIRFASSGSKPSRLERDVSSASNCFGFTLDGRVNALAMSAVSPFPFFCALLAGSSLAAAADDDDDAATVAAAGAGSLDDEAGVCFAGVLDRPGFLGSPTSS